MRDDPGGISALDTEAGGRLKQAAIDAWMASNGFSHDGDRYIKQENSGDNYYDLLVTRPGSDGTGGGSARYGGVAGAPEPPDYSSDFDIIRGDLDTLLGKWQELPKPGEIGSLVATLGDAMGRLSVDAVNGGDATGSSKIPGYCTLMDGVLGDMSGGLITGFKSRFLAQIPAAIKSQAALCIILGGALRSEQGIWQEARSGIDQLITSATGSFQKAAEISGPDWSVAWKMAGWAIEGIKMFGGPEGAAATDVLGLGLDMAETLTETTTKSPSPTYSDVMQALQKAVENLNTQIRTEEEKVQRILASAVTQASRPKRRDLFDLSRAARPLLNVDDGDDLNLPGDPISVDEGKASDIWETYMPEIAAEISSARRSVASAQLGASLVRPQTIGQGPDGPYLDYCSLQELVVDLTYTLAQETTRCAEILEYGIRDLKHSDTGAERKLKRIHDAEQRAGLGRRGSAHDPWS